MSTTATLKVMFAVGMRRACAACDGQGFGLLLECAHRQPCPCAPVELVCTACMGSGRAASVRVLYGAA